MVRSHSYARSAARHGTRALRCIEAARSATDLAQMTRSPFAPSAAIWEDRAEVWASAAKVAARAAFRDGSRALAAK